MLSSALTQFVCVILHVYNCTCMHSWQLLPARPSYWMFWSFKLVCLCMYHCMYQMCVYHCPVSVCHCPVSVCNCPVSLSCVSLSCFCVCVTVLFLCVSPSCFCVANLCQVQFLCMKSVSVCHFCVPDLYHYSVSVYQICVCQCPVSVYQICITVLFLCTRSVSLSSFCVCQCPVSV